MATMTAEACQVQSRKHMAVISIAKSNNVPLRLMVMIDNKFQGLPCMAYTLELESARRI